ncbi:MAG: ABC transporter substrate-binding protein [Actinomycetota bacterium]
MKRLLALLLALATFAVACGDDDAESSDAPPPPNDTADEADDDTADEADDDTADEADDDAAVDDTADEADEADVDMADEDAVPERIVSLSATATEMLFAIGAGDLVVAADQYSNYPEGAVADTSLDAFSPNVEAIASFEPDLVTMQNNGELAAALEALGIAVIQNDAPPTFDGIYDQIEQLGAATGHIDEAAEVVLEMQTEIADLQADAPDATGVTYYHELGTDLFSATSATFIGEIYGLFGLTNVADQADPDGALGGYPQLNEEFILTEDPDLIFLADTIFANQTAETVAARPGWADLTAVQNGGVVELNDDVASRWGPRVVEFAELIADALETVAAPA